MSAEPNAPGAGIGTLLGDLAGDFQHLIRGEIALARSELDTKMHTLTGAAVWAVGGALVSFAGFVVVLLGLAAILSGFMPAWVAMFLVGGLIAILGALISRSAIASLSLKTLTPKRTAASLQKDAQMLKENV